jgi:hypothetical protein
LIAVIYLKNALQKAWAWALKLNKKIRLVLLMVRKPMSDKIGKSLPHQRGKKLKNATKARGLKVVL